MTDTARDASNGHHTPYPSMASLKEAHVALLRRHRQGGDVGLLDNVEEFLARGSATGVYLDSTDDRLAGQSLLDYWVTVLYKSKRTPPDATLAEFDPSLSPALDDSLCPYRGLNAFQEEDSALFHGRHRLVEQLVQKAKGERLLFVVGPSGSGKSSLVLAGLIPVLRDGVLEGSAGWRYLPRMVPGSNPLRNLAATLRGFYGRTAEWAAEQERLLRADPRHLPRLLDDAPEPAVLIVDQFEEVFTLCLDDQLREAFVGALVALAESGGPRHLAVVTMRTDYEPHLVHLPSLTPLIERGQVRITPLTAADLHAAIEEPARRIGLKFEDGIVDALVKDILGEPAGLPLLQFTLLRLWKTREDGRSRITWSAYRRLGGARRALALTADEFYERLPEEKKITTRRILMRMVRPVGISEVVSNRVRRSSLSFEAQYRIDEVLEDLHRAGLVRVTHGDTPGNDQIEVAHEALVRNWPLLVEWVEHDRVAMRQRLRLTAAAEQWLEHGRDAGGLLGGSLLEEALQYDESDLNELEREYVRVSQEAARAAEAARAEAAEREEKLKRERLVALEQKAAEEAKNARRLRLFVPVLAVLTLFALATAAFAFSSRAEALSRREEAERSRVEAERSREVAKVSEGRALENERQALKNAQAAEEAKALAVESSKVAEAERKKAQEEEKKARVAAAEALKAKAEAVKQTELAETRSRELEAQSRVLEKQSRELEEKNEELKRLAAENQSLANLEKSRRDLAEKHREADSMMERDPVAAAGMLLQVSMSYGMNQKDFDPDGTKAETAARAIVKTYRLASERRRRENDRAEADYYAELAKAQHGQILKGFDDREAKVKEAGGPESLDILPVLDDKADYYEYLGESKAALAERLRALDILGKEIAKKASADASSDNGMGEFEQRVDKVDKLYRQGNFEVVEGLYQRVLDLRTKAAPGGESLDVFDANLALGTFYLETGKYDRAEKPFRAALDFVDRSYVSDDTNADSYRLAGLKGLGEALAKQSEKEKREEAVEKYEQLMNILRRAHGGDGNEAGEVLVKLYTLYDDAGKAAKAEASIVQAVEAYEKASPKDSEGAFTALLDLGQYYFKHNRYDEAEAAFVKLDTATGELSLDERQRQMTLMWLGETYLKQGRLDDSKRVFLRFVNQPGEKTLLPRTRVALGLAEIYRREKAFDKAAEQATTAVRVGAFLPGSARNYLAVSLNTLGQIYEEQGRHEEAEARYKEALLRAGSINESRIAVLENYARLLTTLKRGEEAAKMRAEAAKLRESLTNSSQ